MNKSNKSDGFSLLQIIIIAGILAIAATFVSRSIIQSKHLEKRAKEQSKVEGLVPQITNIVTTALANQLTAGSCFAEDFLNTDINTEAGRFRLIAQRNIGTGLANPVRQNFLNSTTAQAAAGRCQTPITILSSATDTEIRYCYQFTPDNGADTNSLLRSPHAFLEIKLSFIHLALDQPISCNDYISGGTDVGIKLLQSLYVHPLRESDRRYLSSHSSYVYRKGP
ncbi:MAG: hypothetical protein HRU19_22210 [Pseudobacteriovorax sp.]|nr:hypothetical protein [Pseudobacteriovorax sp.]